MLYKLYILRAVLLGAIDPLLTMVRHGNAVGKENAAQALSLLALNADNKVRIAESCGIQVCITHACASARTHTRTHGRTQAHTRMRVCTHVRNAGTDRIGRGRDERAGPSESRPSAAESFVGQSRDRKVYREPRILMWQAINLIMMSIDYELLALFNLPGRVGQQTLFTGSEPADNRVLKHLENPAPSLRCI